MPTQRALAGVAHDIAHHAGSGLSYLSPHMAHALQEAGLSTTTVELLDVNPYPQGVRDLLPLRLALQALRITAEGILQRYGFSKACEIYSVIFDTCPLDKTGYVLHTRAVLVSTTGRTFDSGWLGGGAA